MEDDKLIEYNSDSVISKIFEENKIKDLKRFLDKRQMLNTCNFYIMYLFYLIQSAGILTTTIATSYNKSEYVWIGIGLNIFASLIHSYGELNNNMISQLYKDICSIKNNTYIDENVLVDIDDKINKDIK